MGLSLFDSLQWVQEGNIIAAVKEASTLLAEIDNVLDL